MAFPGHLITSGAHQSIVCLTQSSVASYHAKSLGKLATLLVIRAVVVAEFVIDFAIICFGDFVEFPAIIEVQRWHPVDAVVLRHLSGGTSGRLSICESHFRIESISTSNRMHMVGSNAWTEQRIDSLADKVSTGILDKICASGAVLRQHRGHAHG